MKLINILEDAAAGITSAGSVAGVRGSVFGTRREKSPIDEATTDTIQAHGVKGFKRTTWVKQFKSAEQMNAWADKNDAEILGTRDIASAKAGKLAPVVKEAAGINKRVKIVAGSAKGKTGTIGEIRHGAYKGAPKTFTIDIDGGGNIMCSKEQIRLVKADAAVTEAAKPAQRTHKSGCGYSYGHDCDCGGSWTHNSNCRYRNGGDCDCELDQKTGRSGYDMYEGVMSNIAEKTTNLSPKELEATIRHYENDLSSAYRNGESAQYIRRTKAKIDELKAKRQPTKEAFHHDVDHMNGAIRRNGEGLTKPCSKCNGNRYIWTNSEKGKTPDYPWINPNSATVKSTQIKCTSCGGTGVAKKPTKEGYINAKDVGAGMTTQADQFDDFGDWRRAVKAAGCVVWADDAASGTYYAADPRHQKMGAFSKVTGTGTLHVDVVESAKPADKQDAAVAWFKANKPTNCKKCNGTSFFREGGTKQVIKCSRCGQVAATKVAENIKESAIVTFNVQSAILFEFEDNPELSKQYSGVIDDVNAKVSNALKRDKVDDQTKTSTFGLQDADGKVVKVTVNREQAQDFESRLNSILTDQESEKEIAEVIYLLRKDYNIIDVEWSEAITEDDEEPVADEEMSDEAPADMDGELPPEGEEGELDLGDDMAPAPDLQAGTVDLLQQVINLLKSETESRTADAKVKTAKAETELSDIDTQKQDAEISREQEVADMEEFEEEEKEKKKSARLVQRLAKYRTAKQQENM